MIDTGLLAALTHNTACMFAKSLSEPSSPEASAASFPPQLLRLLPVGTKITGRDSHPLEDSTLARRTLNFGHAGSVRGCSSCAARFGTIDLLTRLQAPPKAPLYLDTGLILPTLTSHLAGSTAMMGAMAEMLRVGTPSVELLNQSAGFLIQPLDIPGGVNLIVADRRVAVVWRLAAPGAVAGIFTRMHRQALLG